MAINVTDLPHLEKFKLAIVAHWEPVDVAASTDPEAVAFSPPLVDLRPVLYIPVKRRGGSDTVPQLRLRVQLVEAELRRLNIQAPALNGAEVKVDVANMYAAFSPAQHVSLPSGHLGSDLACDITVSAEQVKAFLNPDGPMLARLNENLFQAIVEIPAIQSGGPLQGTSNNRVYLYRKKSIAFLPGVFGSQFQVDQGKGQKDAFPSFLDDDALTRSFGFSVAKQLLGINLNQRIGVLECDSLGEPILPAFKPKLLRFIGQVYDTFDKLHAARTRRLLSIPESFLVYDLRLMAYDWRIDLTQGAQLTMDRLRLLQQELQGKPDTDDQIAVAGHSTGGVIIRKMLGESGAEALISHAFFLNVPFRGAPKALSVFITGCDPPGGDAMIPFISAPSLRNIAACAPIVYHLAPSFAFPTQVADLPGGIPPGPGEPREREKAAFIQGALDRGIYFLRHVVPSVAPLTIEGRALVAAGASDWGDLIDDASVHAGGRAAYIPLKGSPAAANFEAFVPDQIASRDLTFQNNIRLQTMGWNDFLAGKALEFHRSSEAIAASGKWASKAFIFYSKGNPTTGRVSIASRGEQDCGSNVVALIQPNNSVAGELSSGTAHPVPPQKVTGTLQVEQWTEDNGDLRKKFWTVAAAAEDGDGTVPLRSLLGFGGDAKVFQALPGNPKHVPAPNSDWLWDRVLEVLEGFDVSKFFQSADTKQGLELNASPLSQAEQPPARSLSQSS